MTINKWLIISGIILLILGVLMGAWGVIMFSFIENTNESMNTTGKYCFILWCPTFVIGFILTLIGFARK